MDKQGKDDLFNKYLDRYLTADKKEKGEIIDEIEYLTGMHRKSIIRRFKRRQMTPKHKREKETRGRKVKYGPDVNCALKEVWELANKICGERLDGNIELFVDPLKQAGEWNYRPKTTELLFEMSLGTIKNRIAEFQTKRDKKDYNEDKPKGIKQVVPIRKERTYQPGCGEVDTVAHSRSSEGTHAWTFDYIDIETHWVEPVAQLGKGEKRTVESLEETKERLPYELQEINIDNGGELLNWHYKACCDRTDVKLTRSRAYHKNDNAYVEQKNYTTVRDFIGYVRLDTQKQVKLLNKLYRSHLRDYLNFFQPTMKCIGKEKNKPHNNRVYADQAKTPYQRVIEHKQIDQQVKEKLKEKKQQLNPRTLKENIDKMISKIKKSAQNNK